MIDVRNLPVVGQVSDRFVGFNVELVELTGGASCGPTAAPAPIATKIVGRSIWQNSAAR
ncbi:MAG: hypothetical protein ABIW31_06980 [Novosphingobium sp.]